MSRCHFTFDTHSQTCWKNEGFRYHIDDMHTCSIHVVACNIYKEAIVRLWYTRCRLFEMKKKICGFIRPYNLIWFSDFEMTPASNMRTWCKISEQKHTRTVLGTMMKWHLYSVSKRIWSFILWWQRYGVFVYSQMVECKWWWWRRRCTAGGGGEGKDSWWRSNAAWMHSTFPFAN